MKRSLIGCVFLLLMLGCCVFLLPSCTSKEKGELPTTGEDSTEEPVEDVEIPWIVNGECHYTIVASLQHGSKKVEDCATSLQTELQKILGASIAVGYDNKDHDPDTYQIYVGYTQYPETNRALSTLGGMGDYGVRLIGNKIVIVGHSSKSLTRAVTMFTSAVKKAAQNSSDPSNITLKQSDFEPGHTDVYYANWPAFAGYVKGETILAYDSFQSVYNDVTDAEYDSYCATLEQSGFSLYQSNEIGTNKFATYVNETGSVYVSYADSVKCVNVVVSKFGSTIGMVEPELYDPAEKITDTTFVMYALRYDHRDIEDGNGMCLVTILEDGSYVIFDSGWGVEAKRLYQFLSDNNLRSDGIHIKAWFLSHFHEDHTGGFTIFSSDYGDQVTLDYVIANPAAPSSYSTVQADGWSGMLPGQLAQFGGSPVLVIPRAGQKFTFCGTEFEILYTHEDIFPFTQSDTKRVYDENDTSTVVRMTAYGKTVLVTGDAARGAIDVMNSRYGNLLKSDILQVNHHGHWGITESFFDFVDPTYAVYTTNRETLLLRQAGWIYAPNAYITSRLGWDHIFTCDDQCKLLPMNYQSLDDMTYYSIKN